VSATEVLLTGATGRLGSVVRELHSSHWNLTGFSSDGRDGTIPFDVSSIEKGSQPPDLSGYDLVINCAVVSSPGKCTRKPDTAYLVNSLWPGWLARETALLGIPMIHFSTDLVYSGGVPPYRETSPAVPCSLYGWTKLLGDIAVLHRNPEALVLRTSVLFGEVESRSTTFSQDVLSGAATAFYVDCFRNHTSIRWLAGGLHLMVDSGISGLVLAAGENDSSRSAFAEALLNHVGRATDRLVQGYAPDGTPHNLALNVSWARTVLPSPPLSLNESLSAEYPPGSTG